MSGTKENLVMKRGSIFKRTIRWETSPIIYKNITSIQQSAPVRLTVPLHGLTNGWRVAVSGIVGMTEMNAQYTPPRVSDYKPVTVINQDTIEFNQISSQTFSAYISGGAIQYNTPTDLTGYTAKMQIRPSATSTTISLELTTINGMLVIDTVNKTISIDLSDEDVASLTISSGVYSLEMTSATGDTEEILYGNITIEKEVTREL